MSAWRNLGTTWALVRTLKNWPTYYAESWGWVRSPTVVYRLRNGLSFEARPRTLDTAVLKDVLVRRVYERPGFTIAPGDTVLDIGAHVGFFAASAARIGPGVRVLAFEPHPENFSLLTANLSRNGLSNVLAIRTGVAAASGVRSLNLPANPAGHSLHFVEAGQSSLSVKTASLDDIVRQHALSEVDLLKLDCEGAEHDILEHAMPDPLSRVRRIAMEVHTVDAERTPESMCRLLEHAGFAVSLGPKGGATRLMWATRREAGSERVSSRQTAG